MVNGRASAGSFAGRDYYAFAASRASESSAGTIVTFRVSNGMWQRTHEISAESPAYLVAHLALPVVYVTHDVSLWQHLPRGAVSAYGFDRAGLVLRGTQALSLAATNPRHATITADGAAAIVLSDSGIYNVLPLTSAGSLMPVSAIQKEHGRSDGDAGKPAAPRHMVQHRDGSLFAADEGRETLTRFRFTEDGLAVQQRVRVHASQGARQVAVSACGRWAYVLSAADASISVHRVLPERICDAHQLIPGAPGEASLLMSRCGRFLIRADVASISTLLLDPATGCLSGPSSSITAALRGLVLTPDGSSVAGFNAASGEIVALPVRTARLALGSPRSVATVPGCTNVAFCSC